MSIATRMSIGVVVLGWTALGLADGSQPEKPALWEVAWQWVGDQRPPVLEITLTNPTDTPVELKSWELAGKHATELAFERNVTPSAIVCKPKQSTRLKIVWNRGRSLGKTFDASLRFAHNREGVASPHTIDLGEPARLLPYKYQIDGFLEGQKRAVSRNAQGRLVLTDTYHDGPMVERLLTAFARDYSCIATLHELGTTWHGRKILGLRITSGAKHERCKPAFLFIGAHHANELWSTEVVLDIIRQLTTGYTTDPDVRRWVDAYEIWCVPVANPDGLHNCFHLSGMGRKNGRDTNRNGQFDARDGVDLNRNYPYRWHTLGEQGSSGLARHGRYRGPAAGSEPETKAVMRLADRERFAMLITYHTAGSKILVPYTIDHARNPHPDAAWIVGAHMAALSDAVRPDRDYMPVRNLYSVDGVDQDWHYWRHGTLAFLWEGPETVPTLDTRQKMIVGARPGWQYLLHRLEDGPTLSGTVCDRRTGKALEAVVSLDEITTFEDEVHTTHPTTGRFDRILPVEGTYHLRVEKDGYRTVVVKTHVGRKWKQVRVSLSPVSLSPCPQEAAEQE